jgi:Ca2+-binding RTX toxin-like protein
MYRLQYRNFGTHESLVVNHDVDINGADLAGIRWYELRKVGGNPWSIFQQGDYSPDGTHRWVGSIAVDKNGNMALGYSISSTTTFPSIRYTGREQGEPLGTMPQGEFTIVNGGGSQGFSERWGDYSSMNVDPTDDCTFWYTTLYFPTSANWQTRIASFKFDNCNLQPPDCNNPTIVGNENRNDILQGTVGSDVIAGLSGNDIINGNRGDDEICGGIGNDIINGDADDDRINGGSGNDLINAGTGDDQLYGMEGNDINNAGAGDDLIDGGPDNDIGNGGSGQDQCSNVEIVSGCEI